MSDVSMDDGSIDRRRLLRGAGMATAAGAGFALLHSDIAGANVPAAVKAYDVKDHGATGNGTTDDSTAINNAINAAASGNNGGAVYFPPGDYAIGSPIKPKSRVLLYGSHTPRWDGSDTPASGCRIKALSSFSGTGLIVPAVADNVVAVTIRNLALVGGGFGTNVHGIRLPDAGSDPGNASWALEDITIASCSGAGIYGRLQVANITGCFIHNNRGWGIDASGGNNWNDVHVANCYLFYNRSGNLYFGGSRISAAVDFVNCRFERGGVNPANVFSPFNANAPGVRLATAEHILFVNCNTDANTGSGFECVNETTASGQAGNYRPANIHFANCRFSRDGTGANGSTLPNAAGVKVKGINTDWGSVGPVKCINCNVVYGKADDAGGGTIRGPKYGGWYEYTNFFQWIGGHLDPSPDLSNNQFFGSNNWRPTIYELLRGYFTLPVDQPSSSMPIPDGSAYFDGSTNKLNVRNGGVWKSVTLT